VGLQDQMVQALELALVLAPAREEEVGVLDLVAEGVLEEVDHHHRHHHYHQLERLDILRVNLPGHHHQLHLLHVKTDNGRLFQKVELQLKLRLQLQQR
jgi:hypothetical protein